MKGRIGFLYAAAIVALIGFARDASGAAATKGSEWEGIIAAAKKEGRVVMMGPVGADVRDAFTQGFQKKYPEIRNCVSNDGKT